MLWKAYRSTAKNMGATAVALPLLLGETVKVRVLASSEYLIEAEWVSELVG